LLKLAKLGLKRQQAYELVQKSAMETVTKGVPFRETLRNNAELMSHINDTVLDELFDHEAIKKSADTIFERCKII
jgi:adenylosuccinate lyase